MSPRHSLGLYAGAPEPRSISARPTDRMGLVGRPQFSLASIVILRLSAVAIGTDSLYAIRFNGVHLVWTG